MLFTNTQSWIIHGALMLQATITTCCDTRQLIDTAKSHKVRIADNEHGTRGLVANTAAAVGDVLLSVPVASAINLGLTSVPSAEAALKLVRELKRGNKSAYKAYMDCLPHQIHNIDTFTSADLLSLHGQPWEKLVQQHNELTTSVWQGSQVGLPRPTQLLPGLTLEQYQQLVAVVTSRALGFRWGQEESPRHVKFLVPVFDMANHDPESLHQLRLSDDGQQFELVAGMPVAVNDEVVISYGQLALDELALFYGFLPPTAPFGQLCAADRDAWSVDAVPGSVVQKEGSELGRHGAARELGRLHMRQERYRATDCQTTQASNSPSAAAAALLSSMVCRCHAQMVQRQQQLEDFLGVKQEL